MDLIVPSVPTSEDGDRAWPRTLHVIDSGSPGSGIVAVRIAAALAATVGEGQRILFLGSGRDRAVAGATVVETGAPPDTLVAGPCPPLGDPTLAVRPLRRAIGLIEANLGRFDRLVGWGVAPSLAVALALPGRSRRTVSAGGAVPDRRLFRLARLGPGPLGCLSEEASRSFVAASPAFGPIAELPVPPAAWRPSGERAAIRAAWDVEESTIAVGVLSDDPRQCDLKHAIDSVAFAAAAGIRSVLVVSPRAARLDACREWTETLRTFSVPSLGGGDSRVWITDPRIDRPWSVAAGLDAAFIAGDGIATAGAAAFADRVGFLDRLLGSRLAVADARHRPRAVPGSPLPYLCAAAAGIPILAEAATAPRADCDEAVAVIGDSGDRVAAARAVLAMASDRSAFAALTSAASDRLAARHGPESLERWRTFLAAGAGDHRGGRMAAAASR